jgi:hypothetical protein
VGDPKEVISSGEPPPLPATDEPPVEIDLNEGEPNPLEDLERRKQRRIELERAEEMRAKAREEFFASRGAQDLEPTKIGKSPRIYAPAGWNDRPSYAAQPVGVTDERTRYGLASHQDTRFGIPAGPFAPEADGMEFSRGKMFAGNAPVPYRDDAVGRAGRLEEGIANIQKKYDAYTGDVNNLQGQVTSHELNMSLIEEIHPRRPDGSLSNVGNPNPLSKEARDLLRTFVDTAPGEESGTVNHKALDEAYRALRSERDALRPKLRQAKLRAQQTLMALSKYKDMYLDLPANREDS